MTAERMLPIESDHDTGAVFAAAREHRLVVRSCSTCGADHHLPRAYCYHCGSFDLGWRQVAGRGTLYAWTVVEHPTHPAYEVPYTVVLVDLDEAPDVRLAGNLPGRPALEAGMPMEVWWDDVDGQAVLAELATDHDDLRRSDGRGMTAPMRGVRVLEMAIYAFAPSASAILADWGADVLKVEHPVLGDPGRATAAWGVPAEVNGVSHLWEVTNRGKRAIALDVATPEGREILMQLVDESDVFVTNFLPAARRKLGIEPEDIQGRNPRIIYARGSAQGPRGELSERGGFDGVTYWSRSGASLGVTPPDAPVPLAMPGPGFGDLQSGMALAGGIGSALFHRQRTGEATVVDVSLMSVGLWAMGMTISGTSVLDTDTLPHQHHRSSTNPLVNEYRTRDGGFIALAFLQSDRYWPEFCVLVERDEWLADERFTDSSTRAANTEALVQLLDELFLERDLAEWQELLATQDGQWDIVLPAGQVQHDAQALANGYVQRIDHDGAGKVVLVPAPVQFGGEAPSLGKAPAFGADTDDVLRSRGVTDDAIADLRSRRIIA